MSRLTIREAIKTLRAKNIVRVERGRGTFVNPLDQWTALDALVRATVHRLPTGPFPSGSSRRGESSRSAPPSSPPSAAPTRTSHGSRRNSRRCAQRITPETSTPSSPPTSPSTRPCSHAAGNGLIAALLDPLSQLLVPARRQTSEFDDIRRHALEHHAAILEAIRSGDPEHARRAMHDHIEQTHDDLRAYVLNAPAPT